MRRLTDIASREISGNYLTLIAPICGFVSNRLRRSSKGNADSTFRQAVPCDFISPAAEWKIALQNELQNPSHL
jgi:hypothetical protein